MSKYKHQFPPFDRKHLRTSSTKLSSSSAFFFLVSIDREKRLLLVELKNRIHGGNRAALYAALGAAPGSGGEEGVLGSKKWFMASTGA